MLVMGQQIGTTTPEVHPKLSWQHCEKAGHCTTVHGSVVLEANGRKLHDTHGKNCQSGISKSSPSPFIWDKAICADEAACAKTCALEGVDYKKLGVSTNGGHIRQNYITGPGAGFRTLLMANDTNYQIYKLLGQEFTFDVDMSTLPCGTNGAIFLVSMESDGGVAKDPSNKAGVKYGTGYCDAQCPKNNRFWTCCAEMDLWEANSAATAFTAHPCAHATSQCDPGGCDYNPYRLGNQSFYGPGKIVDTNKVMTVVTQFITADGTANSELTEIRRFYVQGGKVIPNSVSKIAGTSGNAMTQQLCENKEKAFHGADGFSANGGMKNMGQALKEGMVLAFQLWDDPDIQMKWLDSTFPTNANASAPGVVRGPCAISDGVPTEIYPKHSKAFIAFSNIKVGPINSTFHHA